VAQRLIEAALYAARAEGDALGVLDGDAAHGSSPADDLPMPPLTLREEEALHLMAEGLRNKEIAARSVSRSGRRLFTLETCSPNWARMVASRRFTWPGGED